METFIGKVLGDLASLVSKSWFAGMGLVGLVIIMWALLFGTAHDDLMVGAIGAAMMGFGFGEAETRTFRETHGPGIKITMPARKFSLPGAALYLLGIAGAITALVRALD